MQPLLMLAQDDTTPAPPTDAPSELPEGSTIEIDPSAVEGIDVVPPEGAVVEPEVEEAGAVGEVLDDMVPSTGNDSVDGAVNTLTDAVGGLLDGLIAMLPQLVIAVLVLIVTMCLVRLADKLTRKLMQRAKVRESLRDLFRIAVRISVWFAGLMVAAGIVFPGFGFAQLIATAGLASIAIGFAFQNIFENFFAGILILWHFPFENGDFIEVDGVMGRVEDVEIRMTKIRKPNGELVLVPNATVFGNNVTVMTNRRHRRLELVVGIAYGEDLAEGRKVILDAVKACKTVRNDEPPEVLAQAFGASSIDFTVIWWADPTPIDEMRSKDEVIEAIKRALDEAGIEIPYPYRTLTFSKNEPAIIDAVAGRAGGGEASTEN
ncbi:MAG: mechanosensitive ion channel [Planctomycetota bacterium]